jgi:hypothetical protein
LIKDAVDNGAIRGTLRGAWTTTGLASSLPSEWACSTSVGRWIYDQARNCDQARNNGAAIAIRDFFDLTR